MTGEPELREVPHRPCLGCGARILAAVTVPAPDPADPALRNTVTATVCQRCDRHHPAPEVQGVIAYFALHEQVTSGETEGAGQVFADWARYVAAHPPSYGDDELEAEIAQWERGEM